MSHFATLVVIEDALDKDPDKIREIVDKAMAPFMENCCAEPDKMYMQFYDLEDEYLKDYEEGSREMVVMPDGRLLLPWDEAFKKKPTKEDPFPQAKAPEDLPRKQVPFKESYSTFEEFVKEWHGRAARDETYNRYGYFQNPNAKWDWYEIGGRWAGFFQLKKGHVGALGKQYNFTGELEKSQTRADMCFKNAVDFEAMRRECEGKAAVRYDKVMEAIKLTPVADSWEMILAEFDLKNNPKDIDVAREKYHDQPRVKAFQELTRSEGGISLFGWMAGVEEYQIPREQYLLNARNNAAVPFAVIKDGKWNESGTMGWWGITTNEKDPETWNAMVNKLYDELPDQTLLVICDCHI
jgi:hypothetical protein